MLPEIEVADQLTVIEFCQDFFGRQKAVVKSVEERELKFDLEIMDRPFSCSLHHDGLMRIEFAVSLGKFSPEEAAWFIQVFETLTSSGRFGIAGGIRYDENIEWIISTNCLAEEQEEVDKDLSILLMYAEEYDLPALMLISDLVWSQKSYSTKEICELVLAFKDGPEGRA